jgi:DNA repair exonuclease SbcCD nuclease subunit
MKDIIVGDIHLDTRSGDVNFLNYQKLFFDQLFDYVSNNKIRYVIFLGDVFSNPNTVDVFVSDYALKIMENLSKKVKNIIMIKGNHDKYYKNSYDINSIDVIFKDRYNIILFNSYLQLDDFLLINWRNTTEEYVELFKEIDTDEINYMFGHFEVNGYLLDSFRTNNNEKSLTENVFKTYFPNLKYVFSGHYHTPQTNTFIKYLGVPYELSWSECDLSLGFYVLENNNLSFIKNENKMYFYHNFSNIDDINVFKENIIIESDIKKYYKFEYSDKKIENDVFELQNFIKDNGNNVTLINNYVIENHDEEFDENMKELTNELNENKSKFEGRFNFNTVLNNYIQKKLDIENKDDIYNKFISMYEQVKLDLNKNTEL